MIEPLVPRITKSTSVADIVARFPDTEALLQRFELAKNQANLWDGERDGLREVVKATPEGMYGKTMLTKSTGAPVMYPNVTGKYLLESCMQCNIPAPSLEPGDQIVAFAIDGSGQPEDFLDAILHHLQKGKESALTFLQERFIGAGQFIDNAELYEKKGSKKSSITVMP